MEIDDDEEAQYASVKRQMGEEVNANNGQVEEHKRFRFWQQDSGSSVPQCSNSNNSNGQHARGPLNGEIQIRRTHSQPPRATQNSAPAGLEKRRKLLDYIWKEEVRGNFTRFFFLSIRRTRCISDHTYDNLHMYNHITF